VFQLSLLGLKLVLVLVFITEKSVVLDYRFQCVLIIVS